MISSLTRLGRMVLWLLISVLVVLALLVTLLRVLLPEMNRFKDEIQHWVSDGTQIQWVVSDVRGFWRNTHPSLSLEGVQANLPDGSQIQFQAQRVDVEFDLLQSLLQRQPVVANLIIHQLNLDIRSIDWLALQQAESNPSFNSQGVILQRIDNLFLRQLDDFSIQDSRVFYQTLAGDLRQIEIEKLHWQNQEQQHRAEGIVSLADSEINSLNVRADFQDHGSLRDISGNFYISADQLRVRPWLTRYFTDEVGIERGVVSFNAWVTLEHNQPIDGYVELKPSEISWHGQEQHELLLESGILKLSPTAKGWQVSAHALNLRTDHTPWPSLDVAFDWQPDRWRVNVSQLALETLSPFMTLVPEKNELRTWVAKLNPHGRLEDIRISKHINQPIHYSAKLNQGMIDQWALLPEVHHLQAYISGTPDQAVIHASLIDDTLPYGEVFQAPLSVRQAALDLVWQNNEQGWSLWADKITAATPDLQVLGAFRLDFPHQSPPFLSFYAEADLYNAGETWRYLPTLALGQELTDYLSTSIQGGKVKTAKLLWYGALNEFPYSKNNGVFQAWVGLKEAQFSFDTAWPTITDLQLDLLFENDAMYLDSRSATLMGVKAQRIVGQIAELASDGKLELNATVEGQGNAVRDYMTATPLVDSVGAALTTIEVNGSVSSEFQLSIPFEHTRDIRAWGWADLKQNHVNIQTPSMTLETVSGRIHFDNDRVTAAGLSAQLLTQPISFDFKGESAQQGYNVAIDLLGDWETSRLKPYVGESWLAPVSGHAAWQMGVDIQLSDVGFTYQIDTQVNLRSITSDYPYPFTKSFNTPGVARLQASGNQQTISARLQLPEAKYQAEIDITQSMPELKASYLLLGQGSFKMSPVVGHQAQIRSERFNVDQWLALVQQISPSSSGARLNSINPPPIPLPERIDVHVKELTLGELEWHDVEFSARQKNLGWQAEINSQEIQGQASYIEPYDLSISLQRLHIYLPQLEMKPSDGSTLLVDRLKQQAPLISEFDRQFHALMPNLTLLIDDFWLQGYKVGTLNMDFQRQGETLAWKRIDIVSGSNQIHINGEWTLTENDSQTSMNLAMKGENNSDLMERFGITSGIQKAPFEITSQMQWQGSPWSMKVNTLQGQLATKLGKGVISNVSGASKLLGIFSLDSIIRKMQLDFSDIFDKGMAFSRITGSGEFSQGIFVTNNIKMDAIAGEMTIKGMADLNTRTVDAEVNFIPDITSGLPVMTAFAVTPATALYVLAITTVISPVVEVFTQVNYQVIGPIDSPTVKELSRSKGEFKLPEKLKK
ncbi:TIGR02099 family protein [Vibrio sp. V27_P1S3P104]|nr:YhdP family protein [Vibrio fujianensis]NAW70249.1 TIGR02099 family protein [Vibrio sp. V28_P6S34P95]NAX03777.1 TIGR02099 family protein [Vibrio sp. V30_P3S12P165]NAX33530.1 TIGR02099 family protein [Vibrio sp. V29_P1S30P107]NAX38648.1 TIGR02099 family protein [Vibrio sp. V27_P1S3P104]NNN44606.1 TIGR02099 family protein [Vibrio sp. 1-1(7)]NNN73122.1 TIGR02099 family protein [Vibrio sp. 12-2(3-a)]